jgi:predicted ATPase
MHDMERLAASAKTVSELGGFHGFAAPAAIGGIFRGRVIAAETGSEEGVAMMRAGIDAYRATHQRAALPTLLAALAEGCFETGDLPQALAVVVEARGIAESSGELRYKAELHRLEGEIRLRTHDRTSAQRCFERALEVARRQGARWWELRATVSWGRIQTRRRERQAARAALAAILDSVTEGADTSDVQEAKALLSDLTA